MDKLSVKMVPPSVANDVRGINKGDKKLDHPYYQAEERKGSGKATCRQCGETIAEGDPTIYFHYAPDGDNEWIRDRGTIHRDDCEGGGDDWTKCPRCMKHVEREKWPKHWKDHKGERKAAARATVSRNFRVRPAEEPDPELERREAASRARQIAIRDQVLSGLRPEDVQSYHGEPAYTTHDGWKVAQIKTMGDAKYEGTMLNHCLANRQVHDMMREHYGLSEDDNSGEFFFPPPPPAYAFQQHFPDATEEFKEHMASRGHSRIMSLRDPDGIPKATWWEPKDSKPGTEIREVSGFENQPIKDKHAHRILQWQRHGLEAAGMDTGKFEHVGALPEGMNDADQDQDQAAAAAGFRYEPVLQTHVHDLPDENAKYQGQQYPKRTVVTGHCGLCPEDRKVEAPEVPVPGSIPKSLRDRFMDQLREPTPVAEQKQSKKKQGAAYPKDEAEMREHMRTEHAMDDDADKFPDVALGVIHDSDHKTDNYGHSHEDLDALDKEFDTPEVKRDLSEMKGKELGEQLWDAIGGNDLPTHCPNCGTHETESTGKKTDEEGWDYEGMKCSGCGHEFDKDEAGSGMNFTLTTPQVFHDSWRDRDRKANFMGNCMGCGKKTFAFEDGENDPRGPLGDHAASPLSAEDFDKKGPDVPLCFNCANDGDAYRKASDYGHRIWDDDPEAQAETARRQREWEQSRKQGWKQSAQGLDPNAGNPGNKTTMGEEEEDDDAGWQPRVDPYTQTSQDDMMDQNLDTEVKKLQKGLKGMDTFTGSWASVEHVAASPFHKEFQKVREYAEDAGWRINETKKGWQFMAPSDKIQPGFNGIVTTHGSPSDHRAFKNFLGDLKNHGGLIWPPERARQREEKQQKAEQAAQESAHDPRACLESQGVNTEGYGDEDVNDLHGMAHEEAV